MWRTNLLSILVFSRVASKPPTQHQLLIATIPVMLIAHHIANGHTSLVYTPQMKLAPRLPHISAQYIIMFLVHRPDSLNMGTFVLALAC